MFVPSLEFFYSDLHQRMRHKKAPPVKRSLKKQKWKSNTSLKFCFKYAKFPP